MRQLHLASSLVLGSLVFLSCVAEQTEDRVEPADDATSDDATADDATADDATADDATADDATADDATADDATADDATADDATADDATSDDATSDDATGDDTTADDATSDDATADDATSDDATGDDATADDATADDATGDDATADDATGDDATADDTTASGPKSARQVAERLGRDHFLIGLGNDLEADHNQDGAYTLGATLDLHYAYLVGLPGQGGWPDWNPNGEFVNVLADTADAHGVVPMYTLYAMAASGENNMAALTDSAYMEAYWAGAKLLFERLALFGKPAVVHLEPDFFAYTQQAAGDPSVQPVLVGSALSECDGLPETMVGFGQCFVQLARSIAPKVVLGFHASQWAAGSADAVGSYLAAIGAGEADVVVIDMLDRDAGCFEVGTDPNCTRGTEGFYWDETNQTSPNFHEHFAWAKVLSDGVGVPILWWQLPLGVPSDTRGGTPGHYRDNRVKYLFEHVDEMIAAGGVGATFGVGADNQTTIATDGGQFDAAVQGYFAAPAMLPE